MLANLYKPKLVYVVKSFDNLRNGADSQLRLAYEQAPVGEPSFRPYARISSDLASHRESQHQKPAGH